MRAPRNVARTALFFALALHAAAFEIARHIEVDSGALSAREFDDDEPEFSLDLRNTSWITAGADEDPAAAEPDAAQPEPALPPAPEIAPEIAPEVAIARVDPTLPPAPEEPIEAPVSVTEIVPPVEEPTVPVEFLGPLAPDAPLDTPSPLALSAPAPDVPGVGTAGDSAPNPGAADATASASSKTPATSAPLAGDAPATTSPGARAGAGTSAGVGGDADDDGRSLRPRYTPRPAYPASARRAGHAGTVVCRLFVDRDGRVDAVELVESSGHAELDETALATVRRWRFEPLGDATTARRVRVLQRFTFQFERRGS